MMEVGAPQAILPMRREPFFVTILHRVFVESQNAKSMMLEFLIDSQRAYGIDEYSEAEFKLTLSSVSS